MNYEELTKENIELKRLKRLDCKYDCPEACNFVFPESSF